MMFNQLRGPHIAAGGISLRFNGNIRSGFTLIEMMVVIAFGSSIMLTAIALAHTAFTLHSRAQLRFERSFTLDRFIEGFRADVHLANRFELTSEQSLTLFLADDQRVEYRSEADRLTRLQTIAAETETSAETEIARETGQVDQVQLAPGSGVRFSRDDDSGCVVLEVLDAPANATTNAAVQPLRLARQIVVAPGPRALEQAIEEQTSEEQTSDDSQEQP